MTRPTRRSLAALSLLAALCLRCETSPSAEPAERISLRPGAVYPRVLTGRGPHQFHFQAGAGQALLLAVEQRGVDVAVLLRDRQGRLLYEVDTPTGNRGVETVFAVTPERGEYLLIVEPLPAGAKGSFALEVREVRPATRADRSWAAASAAFARAERRRQEHDESRAAVAYREALPYFAACRQWNRLAESEWRLGEALLAIGELPQAAPILERAVERFRRLGDGVGEARALNDLGATRGALGEPRRALSAYGASLQRYRETRIPQGEASAQNNLGQVFERIGDVQEAVERYEAALVLWRRLGDKSSEAVTLENLGGLYSLIGHDDEALDLLEKALALLAGDRDESQRIPALVELGWAQYLAGRPEMALAQYRQALALAETSNDRLAQAGVWDRRGSALRVLKRYDEASDSYLQALVRGRAAGSRIDEGHTLANLGWLDLETGKISRGRKRLERALELLVASGDPNGEVYARVGLSRALRRLEDFEPARQQAEAAVDLVEKLRASLHGSSSRGVFLATRYDAYEELVTLLMELDRREPAKGHAREALEVVEQARAQNLLEEIAGGREKQKSSGPIRGEALMTEIRALDERRRILVEQNPRDPALGPLDETLRARWLAIDQMTEPPAPRSALAPLKAAEIQALADGESVFVYYLLAEPVSFAWTVDHRGLAVHNLPGRARIEGLARRVAAALTQSQELAAQGTAVAAGRELSEAILAPLTNRLRGRPRIVVLPDGALHLVPFAALPDPGDLGRASPEPLLASHEIVTIPSATVLSWQRHRLAGRPPAPKTIAVLADPVFSPEDERLTRPGSQGRGTLRSSGGPGGYFPRLPYTADEATAIAGLVPREEMLLALGPAASRELVLSGALNGYRILHFATHGFLHPVLPERSGILLSLYDEKGDRRDGFLSAPEVAALDLPAELAVLSACETGLGREVRGEGIVGLAQAFFRAGTRRVVVSHWKVRDRATAELMKRFYQNLLVGGLSPAAALRAAQLAIRGEPRWQAPYYWAGFSLQGDWR